MDQKVEKNRNRFIFYKSLSYIIVIVIVNSCQSETKKHMENTAANKAFILDMIGNKKKLKDFPGKASEDMIVHEPSSLPFGGTYKGIEAFEKFYPEVRKFYDFSRFELINVYAEGDAVFAIIKAGIANTADSILLCEHFTFKEGKIIEVRLYLHDFPEKPIHSLIDK